MVINQHRGREVLGLLPVCITQELRRVGGGKGASSEGVCAALDESTHRPQVDLKHRLGHTVD